MFDRVGAAQEYAGYSARPAVLHDLDTRLAGQQLGQALRAGACNFLAADHGDVGQHVGDRLRLARGGDGNRVERRCLRGDTALRRCGIGSNQES